MKLVYIANIRLPTEKAHGLATMKMCEAFARSCEVTLVVPWRFNNLERDPFDYYNVNRNFTLRRLPSLDLVRFGKMGFLIQSLSFSFFTFWYCLPLNVLIYGRDDLSLRVLSFFKKVVWEAHTARAAKSVSGLLKRSFRIIVISEGLKSHFISCGVSREKIIVVPSGVDLEWFARVRESREELRSRFSLPKDKKIVAYVGKRQTMGNNKGVEELAHVLEPFLVEHPFVHFLTITEAQIADVPAHMKAADILVMNYPYTEHYAYYMSPLKLFEYMASGVPILTSDLPTIRETLDDSMAFFFKPGDGDGLIASLDIMLRSPDEAQLKAARALEKVKDYTWEKRAEKILRFI